MQLRAALVGEIPQLADLLEARGWAVRCVPATDAARRLENAQDDLVIVSAAASGQQPDFTDIFGGALAPILIVAALGTEVDATVERIDPRWERYVFEYLHLPLAARHVDLTLRRVRFLLKLRRDTRSTVRLRPRAPTDPSRGPNYGLIGETEPIWHLRELISKAAAHTATVLITGESGTGKELVARGIHDHGPRKDKSFVAINCGAIPATLLESELFGYKRGSFTDAHRDKKGLFEQADGGTLFLDEMGELSPELQVKLLRVLQEREIRPIGETRPIKIDVRIIAATLRDLPQAIADGRFREDLFYRLNVLPISTPPLRERQDDIPRLIEYLVDKRADALGLTHKPCFDDEALAVLCQYPWPGNVRELENMIERALVLADSDVIGAAALEPKFHDAPPVAQPAVTSQELSIKTRVRQLEAELITQALQQTGGNRTNAAKLLDISHRALLYKIKEYGLS